MIINRDYKTRPTVIAIPAMATLVSGRGKWAWQKLSKKVKTFKMAICEKKLLKSKSGLKIVAVDETTQSPFVLVEPLWAPDHEVFSSNIYFT